MADIRDRRELMKLQKLSHDFSICKVTSPEEIDLTRKYCFVSRTDEEISVVCRTKYAPADTVGRSDGWRAFRVEGELDMSLVGIISEITAILAANQIPVFVVSTYNTDYFLIKKELYEKAITILDENGYAIS